MKTVQTAIVLFGGRHPRARAVMAWLHNAVGANRRRLRGRQRIDVRGAFLRRVAFDVGGDDNHVAIGPQALVENTRVYIRGRGNRILIGEECRIKSAVLWIEGNGCTIEIGPETTIEEAHLAATELNTTISLGRDCMLAFGVDIRNGDSHAILDADSGQRLNPAEGIRIGDHVWIAAHVGVLKGVTIGEGSVIGTRSVVTRNIPPRSVACGVPARVVKENVVWERMIRCKTTDDGRQRTAGAEDTKRRRTADDREQRVQGV